MYKFKDANCPRAIDKQKNNIYSVGAACVWQSHFDATEYILEWVNNHVK